MAMDDGKAGKDKDKEIKSGLLGGLPDMGASGCLGVGGCLGGVGCLGCLPLLLIVPVAAISIAWGAFSGSTGTAPRYLQREIVANRGVSAQKRCEGVGKKSLHLVDRNGSQISFVCGESMP